MFTGVIYYLCSRRVFKLTPILTQTLLKTPSNGIAHIMKQFPWYLAAFTFNCLSQSATVAGFLAYNLSFRYPHKKI